MGNSQLETYKVAGNSMNPLLRDGQEVQVQAAKNYEVGDIVVATHPIQTDITIIKRIESISGDEYFRLRGINKNESSDNFGLVSKSNVIGKVLSETLAKMTLK